MVQENGMMLEVLPLEAGGARLVRVYGQDPCVVLPGSVPAPAGGSWPITELGDYCFSEKPRSLPASDAVCRYQVDDTGAVRLTRAFGQAVGGSARRYDFDFDAPAADPDDLHPVCGSFVEEVTLPDRLQVIGSCAFYNCRKLRLLTVGAEGLTLGSDVCGYRPVCAGQQHHRGGAGGVPARWCGGPVGGPVVSRLLGGY